jgi:hypothetical protein
MDLYIEVKQNEDDNKYICNVWDAETSENIHTTQKHSNIEKAIFEAELFVDSQAIKQIENDMNSFREFCNSCKLSSPLPQPEDRDYCSG